ncbi:hypothetical protein RhiirC2_818027 [Rhizophagus irregularis]|uniref:Uncharacterized protein n=1 Tax=Rhizophagus irregularis TaxID=588596 RepID=A0A2N1MGG5_9GLOM|nr:hypothetical protein RhiirC2_818027 [Rhizophagus irregularis]
MQSIDSLRELNAKLLAEIAEPRKENTELKDKNAEIPDLKRKFADIESEKVELKARIAELPRQAVKENADQVPTVTHYEKPLVDTSLPEDRETDAFLDEMHKKKVSNEIRQRNWEKKLSQSSSTTSESLHREADLSMTNTKHALPEQVVKESAPKESFLVHMEPQKIEEKQFNLSEIKEAKIPYN